ncbi:hypothetical protein [Streptomyces noursei]
MQRPLSTRSRRYKDVYEQAIKLPLEFLHCRVWQHSWGRPAREVLDTNEVQYSVECTSCHAIKLKWTSLRGIPVATRMIYPADYCLVATGILETVDRAVICEIYDQRLIEEEQAAPTTLAAA